MTDYNFGGPHPWGSRRRSSAEPLQFGDAEYVVNPVFEDVVHVVNPDHLELGELTFLPGEAKPKWLIHRETAAAAAAAAVPPPELPVGPPGNRAVKTSR